MERFQCLLACLLAGASLLFSKINAAPAGLEASKLGRMEVEVDRAIQAHQLPGGVLWVESRGASFHKALGRRALLPKAEPMTEDTLFDVASLTKVLATTPALMILLERGKLCLDDPVCRHLPELNSPAARVITLRHLLTHTSGIKRSIAGGPDWGDLSRALKMVFKNEPASPPGTECLYSDINFIVLGEVIRRVSGMGLDQFAAREIFRPLNMADTTFLPPAALIPRVAPTERDGGGYLRGRVHDPKAGRMGGVAGHAGVFTTASDVARFSRMMLNEGELDGVRLLKPETVRLMTSVQTPPALKTKRGFGWDIDSDFSRPRGSLFPIGSYGHTGFTGVCLWIDPSSGTFWMLLSNRVHPDGSGNIYALQKALGTLAAEAARDRNEPPAAASNMGDGGGHIDAK
jgi:CubicO group peptidase (beta-lactamase class C family)